MFAIQIITLFFLANHHPNKRRSAAGSEHFIYENREIPLMGADYRMFPHMDDLEIFFYGLAQTMRKLRPLTIAKLKKEMANLVTDAEIQELEEVECKYNANTGSYGGN